MLAVVKAPRTPNTEPVNFRVVGDVPDWVIAMLKGAFPSVSIDEDEGDSPVEWGGTDLHRDIRARMTPAENLKSIRSNFGITQTALAEKAGITKQQVSAMERGKEPIGRKMAHRLADALGTSYGNLFW